MRYGRSVNMNQQHVKYRIDSFLARKKRQHPDIFEDRND